MRDTDSDRTSRRHHLRAPLRSARTPAAACSSFAGLVSSSEKSATRTAHHAPPRSTRQSRQATDRLRYACAWRTRGRAEPAAGRARSVPLETRTRQACIRGRTTHHTRHRPAHAPPSPPCYAIQSALRADLRCRRPFRAPSRVRPSKPRSAPRAAGRSSRTSTRNCPPPHHWRANCRRRQRQSS